MAEKYSSLSPYDYVLNNPMNAIDPDGEFVVFLPAIPIAVKFIAAGIAAYGATKAISHGLQEYAKSGTPDFRLGKREQDKRQRKSNEEDANTANKHQEMLDKTIGTPSPDGTPDPKGGGGKGLKAVFGTLGAAAVGVEIYKGATGNGEKTNKEVYDDKTKLKGLEHPKPAPMPIPLNSNGQIEQKITPAESQAKKKRIEDKAQTK